MVHGRAIEALLDHLGMTHEEMIPVEDGMVEWKMIVSSGMDVAQRRLAP